MIAISGKPGGGKSFYALLMILEELIEGSRIIITNIPIDLKLVQAYCCSCGRDDIDVYSRLIRIPWEQMGEFWRYRSVDYTYTAKVEDNDGFYEKVFKDFPETSVFYVIDEAHEYFNSQEYRTLSKFTTAYIAKHRHLGDEIVWISQALGSVAKAFRDRTQDFRYCRNWAKEKFGFFSKGSGFKVYSYLYEFSEQKGETAANPLQWTKSYKIDKRAKLYSTSLYNKKADTEARKKAPHYVWALVLICTVGVGVVFVILQGPKYFFSKALSPMPALQTSTSGTNKPPTGGTIESKALESKSVARSQLALISKVDLTKPLSLFEDTTAIYDSEAQKLYISTVHPVQVISFVAQAQVGVKRIIRGKFTGYTAKADSGYSWAEPIEGTTTIIFDSEPYWQGKETQYGTVAQVSRFEVHLMDAATETILLPEINQPAKSLGLVPPTQLANSEKPNQLEQCNSK